MRVDSRVGRCNGFKRSQHERTRCQRGSRAESGHIQDPAGSPLPPEIQIENDFELSLCKTQPKFNFVGTVLNCAEFACFSCTVFFSIVWCPHDLREVVQGSQQQLINTKKCVKHGQVHVGTHFTCSLCTNQTNSANLNLNLNLNLNMSVLPGQERHLSV